MSYFDFNIAGGQDLNRALSQLPAALEKRAAMAAAVEGAKLVKAEAKRLVPIGRSKTLFRSIDVVRRRQPGGALVSVATRKGARWRAKNKDAWYAHLVEFGHRTRSGSRIPARPFMRPALDSQKTHVIRAYGVEVQKQIKIFAAGVKTKTAYRKLGFKI